MKGRRWLRKTRQREEERMRGEMVSEGAGMWDDGGEASFVRESKIGKEVNGMSNSD